MPVLPTISGAYSTGHYMTTCGCDNYVTAVSEELAFGFVATGVRIHNTCADPGLYFSLTTDPASTDSPVIPGGSSLQVKTWTAGISLASTSTSTGLGLPTARPRVSVAAWSA